MAGAAVGEMAEERKREMLEDEEIRDTKVRPIRRAK